MEHLVMLTKLTVFLILGVLLSALSRKLRLSNILFLILAGIAIAGTSLYSYLGFSQLFMTSLSIIALVIIVFEASSKFKWSEIDKLTAIASEIAIIFLLMNFVFLSFFTIAIMGLENVFIALIFAVVMAGTSADTVLSMLGTKGNKVIKVLELESIINTPLTILLPFMILGLMESLGSGIGLDSLFAQLIAFLQQFVTGIGSGVIIAIIITKALKKHYTKSLSALVIVSSALLSYIMAENLHGSGILAVTVFGIFFGNVYVKEKEKISTFSTMFGSSLMILVFILLGMTIKLPSGFAFYLKSLLLFVIYLAIRIFSVFIATKGWSFSLREKLFMALNMPKGIAEGVVVFSLSTYVLNIAGTKAGFIMLGGAEMLLNLIIVFMLYSIVLSTIVTRLSGYFLNVEINR